MHAFFKNISLQELILMQSMNKVFVFIYFIKIITKKNNIQVFVEWSLYYAIHTKLKNFKLLYLMGDYQRTLDFGIGRVSCKLFYIFLEKERKLSFSRCTAKKVVFL